MDAKGWRKCTVAKQMVDAAVGNVSDRRLRLLTTAFARLRWHKMEPGVRQWVLAAEGYLDGVSGSRKPSSKPPRGYGMEAPSRLGTYCKMADAKKAAPLALAASSAKKEVRLRLVRCLLPNPFEPLK